MDRRVEQGNQTRDALLSAAVEIVVGHGIAGVTAGKLARAVGTSKSNVFHHFPSTEKIPEAILEYAIEELMKPVDSERHGSVEEVLDALEEDLFRPSREKKIHTVLLAFYHESAYKEPLRDLLTSFLHASVERLAARIMRCSDAPVNRAHAERIALLIVTVLDGFGLHLLTMTDRAGYAACWRLQKNMIMRTIDDLEGVI